MDFRCFVLPAMLILALPSPALAQQPAAEVRPVATLADRAAQLPAIIGGSMAFADYFTPEFLSAVPPAQLKEVIAGLIAQHGAALAVERIQSQGAASAIVEVQFEKSLGRFQMTVDPAQSGRVSGLLVTSFSSRGDSLAAIASEIQALPGRTNFIVTPLGKAAGSPIIASNPDLALAIGSTFKLYILAELAAQAQRGRRGWDQVTPVDRTSFSSAATQNWPDGAPVTLHTLASWMISVSDNGATDILLDVLGREAVGKRLNAIGNSVAARNLPFLNTVEAFALKSTANDDLREMFLAASEDQQRRIITDAADRLTLDAISREMFIGKPLHIDTVEWFASPQDLVRLLDQFRSPKMEDARAIMAINPGVSREAAERWAYVGYKGGSEAGVASMSYLLQAPGGAWYAVTGSWNNANAPVDTAKFAGLMQRLVDQLAKEKAN